METLSRSARLLVIVSALVVAPGLSLGASEADLIERGRIRYENDCSACHGKKGKGGGAVEATSSIPPSDLTVLSRPFEGEFPETYVRRVIDGRDLPSVAHGETGMPVWGRHYRRNLPGYSEKVVQDKIDALVAYLRSIQVE